MEGWRQVRQVLPIRASFPGKDIVFGARQRCTTAHAVRTCFATASLRPRRSGRRRHAATESARSTPGTAGDASTSPISRLAAAPMMGAIACRITRRRRVGGIPPVPVLSIPIRATVTLAADDRTTTTVNRGVTERRTTILTLGPLGGATPRTRRIARTSIPVTMITAPTAWRLTRIEPFDKTWRIMPVTPLSRST